MYRCFSPIDRGRMPHRHPVSHKRAAVNLWQCARACSLSGNTARRRDFIGLAKVLEWLRLIRPLLMNVDATI